jgi:hypothetical protein
MANLDDAPTPARRIPASWAHCAEMLTLTGASAHRPPPVEGDVLVIDAASRTIRWSAAGT